MAEILATFGTAIEAVTTFKRYVLTPVLNQFSYMCFYKGHVQSLSDEVDKLKDKRSALQLQVNEAEKNTKIVGDDVKKWIQEVDELTATMDGFEQDKIQVQQGCFYGICPNIKLRYRLGLVGKKKAAAAQVLLQKFNNLKEISYPAPLVPIPPGPSEGVDFKSRKSKEDEIMGALKDDEVYVIAVCGMGGVGKTTMAKKIMSKVIEGKIFEEVAMTVVSQPLDLKNVQQGIAEGLGLKIDEQTADARAKRLHMRLERTKSVLIILDDVWDKFKLQEIGIPFKTTQQGCKIILTSRNQHVCRDIEASAKIIQLDALPEQEAWNLFKEKAGEIVDEPNLNPIARDVARECKGLPLALITVAAALRYSSTSSWNDVLLQLKKSMATSEIREEVHKPLKWSYEQLKDEEARYLFLLCCLFPEDYEIPLHMLVEYGFSLRIFTNIDSLEEARNRVYRLVEMLIDRFLLILVDEVDITDRYMKYRVKMHDVIRDLAISIASKDKHVFMVIHDNNLAEWPKKSCYDNYTCISLSSEMKIALLEKINCPRLELLRMHTKVRVEIQESSFVGMRELKVLYTFRIESLPPSLSWPTNLRSLYLIGCNMKILPKEIGELVNLEILSLNRSDIVMLPEWIGRLTNLKLLDLNYCEELEKIPPGVISRLVQLEELYMNNFKLWKGVEDTNASVAEVASLQNLTTLQFKASINSLNLLEDSKNWYKLRRYAVVIDSYWSEHNFDRSIQLCHYYDAVHLTPLVQVLFDNAEAIELTGNPSTVINKELSRHGYKNVKRLELRDQDMEFLLDSNSLKLPHNTGFFPCLTTLILGGNDALKEICHGQPPTGSFSNLSSIMLERCHCLKKLFCFSIATMLSKLEFLDIFDCKIIEVVFWEQCNNQYVDHAIIKFPKLSKISLRFLPELGAFCETNDHVVIEFPELYELRIEHCSSLKSFRCLPKGDHNTVQHTLFDQKVNYKKLKTLYLESLQAITNLACPNISSGNFNGLQEIDIRNCDKLKCLFVISMDCKDDVDFPSLEILTIHDCPMLKSFSTIEGINLTQGNCHNLEQQFFVHPKVICTKLKELRVGNVEGATELFGPKIFIGKFCGLKEVWISGCQRLKNIFSLGMFKGLVNLEKLEVKLCPELQEVISKDEPEDEIHSVKEIILPRLCILRLADLPKLIRFCHIENDLELPALELLNFERCPVLETFSLGSVHLPSSIFISAEDVGSVEGMFPEEDFKSQFLSNEQVVNIKIEGTIISETGDGKNGKEYHKH